jgi:hypothetical protein
VSCVIWCGPLACPARRTSLARPNLVFQSPANALTAQWGPSSSPSHIGLSRGRHVTALHPCNRCCDVVGPHPHPLSPGPPRPPLCELFSLLSSTPMSTPRATPSLTSTNCPSTHPPARRRPPPADPLCTVQDLSMRVPLFLSPLSARRRPPLWIHYAWRRSSSRAHLAFPSPVAGGGAPARAVVLHGPVDVDAHLDDPWKRMGNTVRCTAVNQVTRSSRVGARDGDGHHRRRYGN